MAGADEPVDETAPDAGALFAEALRQAAAGRTVEALGHIAGLVELVRTGRCDDDTPLSALAAVRRVLALQGRLELARGALADLYRSLGLSALGRWRLDLALASAAALEPPAPADRQLFWQLGLALIETGNPAEAINVLARFDAVAADIEVKRALGMARLRCDDQDGAAESFRQVLAIDPAAADAIAGLAAATSRYGEEGRPEVIALYRQALALDPTLGGAAVNLAIELLHAGDEAGALDRVSRTADHPDYGAHARYFRANLLLQRGDYPAGFADYETRHCRAAGPRTAVPEWRGEPLAGRRILVACEQGLGDSIQFLRFVPLLKARGATVLLACQPLLAGLLARHPDVDAVCAWDEPRTDADVWVPIMSLPHRLGITLATLPAPARYLSTEPARIARWRERLAPLPGLRVGIGWNAHSTIFQHDAERWMPLPLLAQLGRIPGVSLVSLQKGQGYEQLAALPPDLPVFDAGGLVPDGPDGFLESAAVIENLDLVITIDMVVAHLSAALGRETWVLLKHSADWRWLAGRDDSPWYPAIRLFRQAARFDWSAPMNAVTRALTARSAEHGRMTRSPV